MSSNQNPNRADSQDKSQRALQALKVTIAPSRNPLQSHTAPTTPTRPSLKQGLSTSVTGLSASMTSNKPSKEAKKANNDAQGMDLCPWQIPTDPDDMEDDDVSEESPRDTKSEIQRNTSAKSFTNLTASGMKKARMKRSMSAKKVEKSPVPSKSPKSGVQWPKKITSEEPSNDSNDQGSLRFKEKPRRSLQPVYPGVERNGSPGQKKKVMKTAVGDLEFDLGIDEKCATEGEEPETLFEERSSSKEVHLKELGPVRYSKMSEEDAATVFEMRKRELLAFLIKLGANPNLVKKKFASKNIGALKQSETPTHLSDMRGSTFDRERVMRSLKGTLEDNLSPNRFIVYNTDRDPLWNNPRGRFATPSKTRNRAASSKIQGKSDPPFKRRNSAKILREKDELTIAVKKNLTASFNVVLDGEMAENKSPVRIKKNRDPYLRNSHQIVLESNDFSETKSPTKVKKSGDLTATNKNAEEQKEPVESFTIDLVKFCSDEKKKKKKKKSKKTKKAKNGEEQAQQSEKQSDTNKLPSENISINTVSVYESQEDHLAYQKLIEAMRMKSKVVLGDINQIDLQIQKMKEDGKKGGKNQKRGREEIVLTNKRDEKPKQIFLENLDEGYANVAKMKNAKRSGSFSVEREQFEYTPKVNGQKGMNKRIANTRENETERLRPGQDTSRSNLSKNNRTEVLAVDNKNKKGASTQMRAPSGEMDRKIKATVENENRKRNDLELNDRRAIKNDLTSPKATLQKQVTSPTNNFFGRKEAPEISKSKVMAAPEKNSTSQERKQPNQVVQPQPVPTQANDRNKLLNAFRNPSSTSSQTQNAPQRFNDEALRKSTASLSNSQVQSNKDLTNPRLNRPVVVTNDKKQISSPNTVTPTQVPSTATSNKSPLLSKQPIKKTLTTNKSQQSFEKDSMSDINESTELFDKYTTNTKTHKSTKSATKSTFSEGVKKILKEGSKEDNQLTNSKLAVKNTNKSPLLPGKQNTASNRPQFEIPAASDIRTKMYKEGRLNQEDGTLVKINYVQNGAVDPSKRDLKDVVMEQMRQVATTKKANQPEIQFPQNAGRKGSLSPRSSKNIQMKKNDQQINSLQDITEKKNRGAGAEDENAERLKLLGQSVKPKREMSAGTQNQNKPYRQ